MPPTVNPTTLIPSPRASASCCTIARMRAVSATRFSDSASASVRFTVFRITARYAMARSASTGFCEP